MLLSGFSTTLIGIIWAWFYRLWHYQMRSEMLNVENHLSVFSAQRGTFKKGVAGWESWPLV